MMAKDTIKVNMNIYDIPILVEQLKKLEQENKQLKELKFKFFDNSGDEESFTLEDYLEISNKLYDYEEENKQLKSILTDLEEWLEMMEEKETIGTYSMVQDKIQKLKEKYK